MKPISVTPVISPAVFAYAFVAAALFALTSRYPGYVHHDTAEIAMWSELGWPLGLPKHPPLLPWLFRIVATVVPLNWVTLSLLTAANIVLGAWAVWRIALMYLSEERAAVALMLYGLSPAGTFFALKLNHNAILVSLWPLTILAFLLCLREDDAKRSAAKGIAFGAMAAACMLAKYYSGVLLACCFAASLGSVHRNRFFRLPGGYVAVGVFLVLMAPHAWWMLTQQGDTLAYGLHESAREANPMLHFLLLAPLYLVPPMAGLGAIEWWLTGPVPREEADARTKKWTELWTFASAPFLLTAVLISAFHLRGATSWALPDFCVATVLLAGMLPPLSMQEIARIKAVARAGLWLVALAGPVVLVVTFSVGEVNTVEPRAEVARAAGRIFTMAAGRQPGIVAGDPQSANAAALVIASRPTALTNFNAALAPWVTPDRIVREGVLAICRPNYSGCSQAAEAFSAGRRGFVCFVPQQRGLLWMTGRVMTAEILVIMPEGTGADEAAARTACSAGGAEARFVRMITPNV